MVGMAIGMLAAAEGRKERGLMVAGVLEQSRDVGRWLLGSLQQGWRLMAGMAAGMLATTVERKEDDFS
ncbi:hypothetical protein Pyn_10347 [Prunus yedoensis var. nudiflora]|uniref:Uncharacterized protein n=1 Tax=Prunus yedoensis var. nudiflora TaxID=2094558 RepID=A0A314YMH8_PRUYE|nr:hypothetical protein Pyn_10347 [Prunus yedoensis var. nudiflora]